MFVTNKCSKEKVKVKEKEKEKKKKRLIPLIRNYQVYLFHKKKKKRKRTRKPEIFIEYPRSVLTKFLGEFAPSKRSMILDFLEEKKSKNSHRFGFGKLI